MKANAALLALARRVSKLNPDGGTIGAGMLHTLVAEALYALEQVEQVEREKASTPD